MNSSDGAQVDQLGDAKVCANCGATISGLFCPTCGRRHRQGIPPIPDMLSEFFTSFLEFDKRIMRTIGALFVPGRLTREFRQGRGALYISPMRTFLVTAAAAFGTSSLLGSSGPLLNTLRCLHGVLAGFDKGERIGRT